VHSALGMTEFVPAEDMDENTEYITTGSADLNRILAVICEFCGAKQVTGRKIVQGIDVRFYLIGSIILLFTGILALWLGFFLGSVPDVREIGGELQVEGSLHSLFLPTLYIIYAPSTYEATISRGIIIFLNNIGKLCKGAQGAAISI